MKMQDLARAFQPNRAVSKTTMQLLAVLWAAMFLCVWAFMTPKVVPRPGEVLSAFSDLWHHGGLVDELFSSLSLNFQALAYSMLISLGLAYATVVPAFRPAVIFVSKLRFLGFTGLTFLFGLAFTGHDLKVWMLVMGMSVFFVTSMAAVVAAIPKEEFDYARTLRMSEWRTVYEVVIRGSFDQAIETLRQNAAMGWMMLTMVEGLVRSEGGLGALMLNENKHFKLEAVFAIQATILTVGILQDYLIGAAKNLLCPYASVKLERK